MSDLDTNVNQNNTSPRYFAVNQNWMHGHAYYYASQKKYCWAMSCTSVLKETWIMKNPECKEINRFTIKLPQYGTTTSTEN